MKSKGALAITVFLLLLQNSFAQTSGSITVGGDFDKFYPVTWNDPAWDHNEPTVLNIGRSSVHENSTWRGALISSFTYHLTRWGNGAHFIDASIKNSVVNFIAGWRDATPGGSSSCIIIWLRGGGTTYYFHSNYAITPTVYDNVQNPLPFQEHNGPAHAYKTTIDIYVNSDGVSNSGVANFPSGGNNYFGGNIGIGTASPASSLDIKHVTPIITLSPAQYNGVYRTTLGTRAGAQSFLIMGNNGQNEIRAGNTNPGGYLDFFTNNTVSQENESNGTHVMRLAANGDVGIGTTTPREKLSVNGKIRAHEIKVETSNWPDYVFAPEHTRLSLPALSKYIKENNHLPEIPSAAEAEKDGINLGEMNKKLLQKVEELTLYLIEMKQELEEIKIEKLKIK